MQTRRSPGLGLLSESASTSKLHASLPSRARSAVLRLLDAAHDLVFPAQCTGCGAIGAPLCDRCAQSVTPIRFPYVSSPLCGCCGRLQRQPTDLCTQCRARGGAGVDFARSASLHQGIVRDAIHQLKYEDRRDLAPLLARYLVAALAESVWEGRRASINAVIPIPLHHTRLVERGYNQAHLLAKPLPRRMNYPLRPDLLQRSRETASQVGMNALHRRQNVEGAFTAGDAREVTALLIDDVHTTGATLNAAATALKAAGAVAVFGLTLAEPAFNPVETAPIE